QELHPSDEGREGHGDPGEPGADQAAAGVPETLTDLPLAGMELPPPQEVPVDRTASLTEDLVTAGAGSALVVHRLNVLKDELVAWFKTLASAAGYATLIVTFCFPVRRGEGRGSG